MRLRMKRDGENNVNYIPFVSDIKEVMWTLVKIGMLCCVR